VSAGQFSRRIFLTTTGAATAGAIVATSLPTPAHAASADSADSVGFSSDGNPFITSIYTADPDAFGYNGRLYVDTDRDQARLGANGFVMTASGDPTDARAVLDADFVGEVNDLHDDGDLTDAQAEELVTQAEELVTQAEELVTQAEELVTSATLLSSTILQSTSS
jgi:predicted secreted protein